MGIMESGGYNSVETGAVEFFSPLVGFQKARVGIYHQTATIRNDYGNVLDLFGKSKIGLVESGIPEAPGTDPDDYAVLDKNATGGSGALLALPNPGLDRYIVGDQTDEDTMSDYSIFVRPLGKPLGWATITTCAEVDESGLFDFLDRDGDKTLKNADCFDGDAVASIEKVVYDVTFRNKGKTTFVNVTAELTTIVLAVEIHLDDGAGGLEYSSTVYVRVPIFDDLIMNEYWEYDNDGLKHLQVRIYPWETDVSAGDDDLPDLPQEPQP